MAQIRKYNNGTPDASTQTTPLPKPLGKIVINGTPYDITENFVNAIEKYDVRGADLAKKLRNTEDQYIFTTPENGFKFSEASGIAKTHGDLNARQEIKMGMSGKGGRKVRREKAEWHDIGLKIVEMLKQEGNVQKEDKPDYDFSKPLTITYTEDDKGNAVLSETDVFAGQAHLNKLKDAITSGKEYTLWDGALDGGALKDIFNAPNYITFSGNLFTGPMTPQDISNAKNLGIIFKKNSSSVQGETPGSVTQPEVPVQEVQTPETPIRLTKVSDAPEGYKHLVGYVTDPNSNYFFGDLFRSVYKRPENEQNVFYINGKWYVGDTAPGLADNSIYKEWQALNLADNYAGSNQKIKWDWANFIPSLHKTEDGNKVSLLHYWGPWAQYAQDKQHEDNPNILIYRVYNGNARDAHGFGFENPQYVGVNDRGDILYYNKNNLKISQRQNSSPELPTFSTRDVDSGGNILITELTDGNDKVQFVYNPKDKSYYAVYKGNKVVVSYNNIVQLANQGPQTKMSDILKGLGFSISKGQKGLSHIIPTKHNEVQTDDAPSFDFVQSDEIFSGPIETKFELSPADIADIVSISADGLALITSWAGKETPSKPRLVVQGALDLVGTGANAYANYLRDDKQVTFNNVVSTGYNLLGDAANIASGTKKGQEFLSKLYSNKGMATVTRLAKAGMYGVVGVNAVQTLFDKNTSTLEKVRAGVTLAQLASVSFQKNPNEPTMSTDKNGNYVITSSKGKKIVFTPDELEAYMGSDGKTRLEMLNERLPKKKSLRKIEADIARSNKVQLDALTPEQLATARTVFDSPENRVPLSEFGIHSSSINKHLPDWKWLKSSNPENVKFPHHFEQNPRFRSFPTWNARFLTQLDEETSENEVAIPYAPIGVVELHKKGGKVQKFQTPTDTGLQNTGGNGGNGKDVITDPKNTWFTKILKGATELAKNPTIQGGWNSFERILTDFVTAQRVQSDLKKANSQRGLATKSLIPDKTGTIDLSPIMYQHDKAYTDMLSETKKFAKTQTDNKVTARVAADLAGRIGELNDRTLRYTSSEIDKNKAQSNEFAYKNLLGNLERSDYNRALNAETSAGGYSLDAQLKQTLGQSMYKLLHERAQEQALQRKEAAWVELLKNNPEIMEALMAKKGL